MKKKIVLLTILVIAVLILLPKTIFADTCVALGGKQCCVGGQTCNSSYKISGASDCTECCSEIGHCEGGTTCALLGGKQCCDPMGQTCNSSYKILGASDCTECCSEIGHCEAAPACPTGWVRPHKECFGTNICQSVNSCGVNACDTPADCTGGGGGGIITIEPPITATSFEALVAGITNFLFIIALVLAPLMIIIGAIYLLTSGGDPKKLETGKNIIIYTLIGLAIILLAKGLIAVLKTIIGVK